MTYWLAPLLLCLVVGGSLILVGFGLGRWFERQDSSPKPLPNQYRHVRTFPGSER